jgi:hypothetical protein
MRGAESGRKAPGAERRRVLFFYRSPHAPHVTGITPVFSAQEYIEI